AGCGKMVLGSDSHTRYGCYGTMAVGEGGGELAKQLLNNTWDIEEPEVVLVYVDGKVPHGIGPHDVAIALVGATFPDGFVKNKVLEFAGPGIRDLSIDFRIGVDVMTTETSCLSSIWETDDTVKAFFENVGRPEEYKSLAPEDGAYYDSMVTIHLDEMQSMIALPFHPSKAYTIHELQENPQKILKEIEDECNASLNGKVTMDLTGCIGADGLIHCDQGVIAGCAGGMFENITEAADILRGKSIGNGYFDLSVYPSSMPINLAVTSNGVAADLMEAGAVMKPCFCGPCFGAGDTPANNTLSIRHTTRNFANREGSKPGNGQIASVALMDARSIAATAANGGVLTAATDIEYTVTPMEYKYTDGIYEKRCYFGFGNPLPEEELRLGPNIRDWPKMPKPQDNLLVQLCAVIHDDVTTTDELIPSGETSSYRSNPIALSEFALSRRVPDYVERSKAARAMEEALESGAVDTAAVDVMTKLGADASATTIGSCVFAHKPGDGSAREQAASCQKVLGGFANICYEYATKRYRSNCLNWGIVPFTMDKNVEFNYNAGDWVYIPGVISGILKGQEEFDARVLSADGTITPLKLYCKGLSDDEKKIVTEGCLMNYYAAGYGAD
ncbi:MAG: hydratase, partial [Parasporobacterium sp.]|nr:hydratase [Parasporobacterium sp.]